MIVPQTNELDVWILKGMELTPLASMARSGYVALPWFTVTPVVDVVSVVEIAVSLAQPLFLTAMLRLTHSLLLTMPLLLPFTESSRDRALNWMFELPVRQKFC